MHRSSATSTNVLVNALETVLIWLAEFGQDHACQSEPFGAL